jgi:hypothetical protein
MNQYLLEAAVTGSTRASKISGRSRATRWSVGLIAAIGLTALVLATMATWLIVTDPATVSYAISTGNAEVLLHIVGNALIDFVRILIRYL